MRRALPFALLLGLAACTGPPDHYYWGNYEGLLFRAYEADEGVSEQEQIETLLDDIDKAQAVGKQPGPGINLHLAMLYAQLGDAQTARRFVAIERELYPTSEAFSASVFVRLAE